MKRFQTLIALALLAASPALALHWDRGGAGGAGGSVDTSTLISNNTTGTPESKTVHTTSGTIGGVQMAGNGYTESTGPYGASGVGARWINSSAFNSSNKLTLGVFRGLDSSGNYVDYGGIRSGPSDAFGSYGWVALVSRTTGGSDTLMLNRIRCWVSGVTQTIDFGQSNAIDGGGVTGTNPIIRSIGTGGPYTLFTSAGKVPITALTFSGGLDDDGSGALQVTTDEATITKAVTGILRLKTTGVSAGIYPNATVTVNAYGQLTTVSSGTASGGTSVLAVTTGSATGFSTVTSSPTAVVNFSSNTYKVTLTGGATAYIVKKGATGGDISGTDDSLVETLNDGAVTVAKLAGVSPPTANKVVTVNAAGTGFTGITPMTTYWASPVSFGTPDFSSTTANALDVTASTNPTYGKMRFTSNLSSTTNCAFWTQIAPPDYNTSLDPRMNQMSVMNSSATDSGTQEWNLSVSSIPAGGDIRTLTYAGNTTIFMPNNGSAAFAVQSATGTYNLSGWSAKITPGMPYAVKGCRDATDATNDTSGQDSFMLGWQMRYATTTPGQ